MLGPLYTFTEELQKQQYVAGDFFRSFYSTLRKLNSVQRHHPEYLVAAQELERALLQRFEKLKETIQFAAAVWMDPRFTNQHANLPTIERQHEIVVRKLLIPLTNSLIATLSPLSLPIIS